MLTEMTRSIGITAAIPPSSQTLDQIELIGLVDRRVLMIVVTRDRTVRNRVIALDELISRDAAVARRSGRCRGRTLDSGGLRRRLGETCRRQ